MHIDHIAIWTADLEKEKAFFLKYFNCTACKMYSNPGKHFSSCFISFADGSRIELMKRKDIGTRYEGENLGYSHIAINVGSREKVEKLTEMLEKDGFTIKGKPRQTGDGYYESVVLDPENNIIELTC
jgi:lactoylglutathione lyase